MYNVYRTFDVNYFRRLIAANPLFGIERNNYFILNPKYNIMQNYEDAHIYNWIMNLLNSKGVYLLQIVKDKI